MKGRGVEGQVELHRRGPVDVDDALDPHDHMFPGANGNAGNVFWLPFLDERANDGGVISASAGSSVRMSTSRSTGALNEQTVTAKLAAATTAPCPGRRWFAARTHRRGPRAQQQDIVDVDHRGVGGNGVRLPAGPP